MKSPESPSKSEVREEYIEALSEFSEQLSEILDEGVSIEYIDGTYEIETDNLTLTFAIDDGIFEIRLIDTHGVSGMGGNVLNVIHAYSEENNLDVIASNVVDEARGFWEKNGYQEGEEEGQFFRSA